MTTLEVAPDILVGTSLKWGGRGVTGIPFIASKTISHFIQKIIFFNVPGDFQANTSQTHIAPQPSKMMFFSCILGDFGSGQPLWTGGRGAGLQEFHLWHPEPLHLLHSVLSHCRKTHSAKARKDTRYLVWCKIVFKRLWPASAAA